MCTITLRAYQSRIAATAEKFNTIVLLPTGSGKTLVAAEIIARLGTPSVFFVPTVPLVGQQAKAIGSRLPSLTIGKFHGETPLPKAFDVLVTTPKAFDAAQTRGSCALSWRNFKVVVFDEVHHVIKDHPYRHLALKLKQSSSSPRVVGLTASLTYAVGEKKINSSVSRLCNELKISKIEHATDEELWNGGYTGGGRGSLAELRTPSAVMNVQHIPEDERKPHLIHRTFFTRIKNGNATNFGADLYEVIRELEGVVASSNLVSFSSPLSSASLKSWGLYAHKNKGVHIDFVALEHLYEALRLFIISWEEDKDVTMEYLKMMTIHCHQSEDVSANQRLRTFFNSHSVPQHRFGNMFTVLKEKYTHYGQTFRCILFVKQRIVTHVLKHAIESHPDLGSRIDARCLYSTKAPASASLSLSKHESASAISDFLSGKANMMIATNVAEEGIDIPSGN